jgi:serine/threonine protein kinase/tetratricopeptide (TPR) repeat protein
MIGETISHYRILEHLGTGGMGAVYKAEDLKLQRHVALKLMLDEAREDELAKSRFLREARAASSLNHPNIAVIYEIDEVERNGARYNFIVMEYVDGQSLKQRQERFGVTETVDIIRQIADALAEAHEHGIVHRDVKPSNVMLNELGRVKMLDFGVAKFQPIHMAEDDTASLYHTDIMKTAPGMVVGTFAYMSPEQALGLEVDQRSDIFSLGVVFYEMLAGQLPFQGRTTLAMVDGILHSSPRPLRSVNARISPELEGICLRMLAKDRELRYKTLRDVVRDLDRLRSDLSTAERSDPFQTSIGRTESIGLSRSSPARPETYSLSGRAGKSIAVMTFANVTKNEKDEWLGVGIAETVTADLKNIEGLTIIGRERVFEVLRRFGIEKQSDTDTSFATQVGREIGARWIIGGGYQRLGEMVRITARFVDVESGEVMKTVKIDGQIDQIFELQDKIVDELSDGLELSLRSGEREVIARRETDVIEAYEAFSNGMIALRSMSREAISQGISFFDRAIELDPKYSRAHGMRGYALGLTGQFLSRMDLMEAGVASFQLAIEYEPTQGEAYAGLGMVFIMMDRVDEGIGAIRRALSFSPDDAISRAALGRAFMIGKGMFREAAAEYERALVSNPMAGWVALQLAHCYAYLGDYARGEQVARIAVSLQEQMQSGQEAMQIVGAHTRLGHLYALQDRFDDAISEYYQELVFLKGADHMLKARASIEANAKLVSAYIRQANQGDAETCYAAVRSGFDALLEHSVDEPFTRYYVACAAAMMGDHDLAFEHLRHSVEKHTLFITARARVDRDLDSLRSDARFHQLIGTTH